MLANSGEIVTSKKIPFTIFSTKKKKKLLCFFRKLWYVANIFFPTKRRFLLVFFSIFFHSKSICRGVLWHDLFESLMMIIIVRQWKSVCNLSHLLLRGFNTFWINSLLERNNGNLINPFIIFKNQMVTFTGGISWFHLVCLNIQHTLVFYDF